MTTIIDFESAKDRQTRQEIDLDAADWNSFRDQLITTMIGQRQVVHNEALTVAALNALIEVLQRRGLNLDDAKTLIASRLKLFF